MKLRYQMRGLGIGIIITALLMGVGTKKGMPLTDAEIKAKALALGMVESDSLKLTDIAEKSPAPADESGQKEINQGASEESGAPEADPGQGTGGGETNLAEDAAKISDTETVPEVQAGSDGEGGAENGETVSVTIEFGETSYHVSQTLEELGLVEDAAEFDNYLCEMGYSRKINAGVYQIASGSSEEEIINIITRNR